MQKLAPLRFTDTGIAKVRALKDVTVLAICAFLAIAQDSKRLADGGVRGCFGMSKEAIGVGAMSLCIMQTVRSTLGAKFMRQVTPVAMWASLLVQHVFAQGYLVWVMEMSAGWAFGAGTYISVVSRALYVPGRREGGVFEDLAAPGVE